MGVDLRTQLSPYTEAKNTIGSVKDLSHSQKAEVVCFGMAVPVNEIREFEASLAVESGPSPLRGL